MENCGKTLELIELVDAQPTGLNESKITPEILSLLKDNPRLFYRLETASGAFWMLSHEGYIFAQNKKMRTLEDRLTRLENEIVAIRQEMKRGSDSSFS